MNKNGSFIFILVAIIVLAGAFYFFLGNNSTGAVIYKCTDTDEEFDIYFKGNATSVGSGDAIYIADECMGLTGIKEAYCDGNTATAAEKFCPTGYHCNDGACIETSECNDLVDNDGDGTKDYPADTDCTSLDDSAE